MRDKELIAAILKHDPFAVRALLRAGANANAVTEPDPPPPAWKRLWTAVSDSIRFAIGRMRGYIEFRPLSDGTTLPEWVHPVPALVLAASEFMPEEDAVAIIEELLAHGAAIDAVNGLNNTALVCAANHGKLIVVDRLLKRGADINRSAALVVALRPTNRLLMLHRFLEGNPDVNVQDDFGNSALMAACYDDDGLPLVQLLLDAGADPTLTNSAGDDALAIARSYEHTDIVACLTARKPG